MYSRHQRSLKQLGTLERHDVSLEDVEKVFVRLTPHPDKQIIADVIAGGSVYRCTEGKTLINYPTFLSEVAPGGLENYRRFVAWVIERAAEQDPATSEFASGKPPEAFASSEELRAYDAYLEGRESVMPVSAPAGTVTPTRDPEVELPRTGRQNQLGAERLQLLGDLLDGFGTRFRQHHQQHPGTQGTNRVDPA